MGAAMTDKAYTLATEMQRMAADPMHSVFVSANAGSGKTRVLVARVSRLLLAGTLPDKILCLTYTKAAASEMQARLFEALGSWAILDAQDLTEALNELQGQEKARSEEDLGRARLLFARALETPGGLKVQTIHAFCEKLLRRFPLEAGLAPGTDAIDEADARALQEQVWTRIERTSVQNPRSEIAEAITLLSIHKGDEDMERLYRWAMGSVYKMQSWREAGGVAALAETLGVSVGLSVETAKAQAWEAAPKAEIHIAARDMQMGGKTDQTKADCIFAALTATTPAEAYQHYERMFFTQKGTPNASMVTGKAGMGIELFGSAKTGYQPEALRMIAAKDQVQCAHVLELTNAVYVIAQAMADQYAVLKLRRRVMDFDDQIHLARRLLLDSEAADWVRYKLDGGVDHVLVDEAQDTSGVQWDIVGALSDPFFQPSPDADPRRPRTLFAVGDEKQSIYSFQGAEPELFLEKIQALSEKQTDTPEVKMSMSFRSTEHVLALVDEIFYQQGGIKETFDAGTFAPASDQGGHSAYRDDPGLVEFWPAVKAPEKPEVEIAWEPVPVDTPSAQSPREQLAREIAVQIKSWLDTDEPVFDRDVGVRPMQARDIMILVTKRTDFFDAVIRNLKERGVPVAGADRLTLTESIAVQDLLSLAKFTLLPSDDLSLAEVLKSPLVGWDEDQLFEIASGRDGRLWQAVPEGDVRDMLVHLQGLAHRLAPYEFFARTLAYVPKSGGASLLQNIYTRLGVEAADAIEAFLARALAHQRHTAPSLIRFVRDIENDENKIKREMDTAQNEVRVMSVHAAKGLEAPVVILPDTTQIKTVGKDIIYPTGDGGYVMRVAQAEQPEVLSGIQDRQQAASAREAMRLLYVALTRAESRLLICGFESHGKVADGSWHQRIERALTGLEAQEFETVFGAGLRYGRRPEGVAGLAKIKDVQAQKFPDWARKLAPPARQKVRHVSPSHLLAPEEGVEQDVPVRSPLLVKTGETDRFTRGNHIHKLLQILPDLDVSERRASAQAYLQSRTALNADMVREINTDVFAVLENEKFADFFAKGSRAEVSVAGWTKAFPKHIRLSGQIDRLCVLGDTVWILDYKSNRPPPAHEKDVAPIYVRQMAAYRALVADIFPDKIVKTALLWTDGPHLMVLSDALLDSVDWDVVLPP